MKKAYNKLLDQLDNAKFLRDFHGWFTIFSVVLWVVATFTDWISSVRYVSHLSQAALTYGGFSAWQASRTEVKIDKDTARLK